MKMIVPFIISVIVLGSADISYAGEFSFRCKVENEYELTENGQLVKAEKGSYRGSSFSVERSTGRIVGGAFNNKGDYQIKVADSGKSGSFKVFSYSENRKVTESLAIITRSEAEKKPFVGIDFLQAVVTGTCD